MSSSTLRPTLRLTQTGHEEYDGTLRGWEVYIYRGSHSWQLYIYSKHDKRRASALGFKNAEKARLFAEKTVIEVLTR